MRYRSLLAALLACPLLADATCTVTSGELQRPVVMLFTSEGCSSCPPADRWASRLKTTHGDAVLVLGFHVAYWDYIGWKDRFADTAYTELQRRASERVGMRGIYTPQVMVNGVEQRTWPAWSPASGAARARATVSLSIGEVVGGSLPVSVAVNPMALPRDALELLVILTEDRLTSQVRSGENRGATLRHDAVARRLAGPLRVTADAIATRLTLPADADLKNLQVAAVLVNAKSGEVVQSVSADLCSKSASR